MAGYYAIAKDSAAAWATYVDARDAKGLDPQTEQT